MNPLVTVIVPVYNAEKYVDRCLSSIEAQTYQNYECLCIDDGSVDKSGEIIQEFTDRDQRFAYIYQPNSGPSAARNKGLENAKGEYILFIDSDDTVEHDYLDKLVEGIVQSGGDICNCGYQYKGKENYYFNDYFPISKMTRDEFLKKLFMHTGGLVHGGIYKSSIISQNKIRFNDKYSLSEDQLFNLQYYLKCSCFYSIDYNGYNYYENAGSLSKAPDYNKWYNQIGLMDYMASILLNTGYSMSQINKMLESKRVNVITQIAVNCNGEYQKMFDDELVVRTLKEIHIKKLWHVKYILPLKLKCVQLTKWAYL